MKSTLLKLRNDFLFYSQNNLKIRTKAGQIQPLTLNKAQLYIHAKLEDQLKRTGKIRALILKGRQQGCSTYTEARFYWRVTFRHGVRAFILTHEDDATKNLFEMAQRFHEHSSAKPSTRASNAKELEFDLLDSGYRVGTAGNKSVGRSNTIQYFHGCLSPDTFILRADTGSLCRMDEVSIGDAIRTHSGAIAAVSFISRQRKDAAQITLKGLGQMPLTATWEHQFLTESGWKQLGDIAIGDNLLFPVPRIHGSISEQPFAMPHIQRQQGGGSKEAVPETVIMDYNLGRILGLYLAEGCIKKQVSGQYASVEFAVHDLEAERTVKWLNEISHLFKSYRITDRKNCKTTIISVYGKSFSAFVDRICGNKETKRMPDSWNKHSVEFVKGIIHGYLSGDGHSSGREYDRRISAPSIRSAITIGMRDALAALDYGWASISYHPGRMRYEKKCQPIWTLRLTGKGVDKLCHELNWQMPPRRRHGDYGSIKIQDGYALVPVIDICPVGEIDVMDFEVDHPDHSYCTVHAASHNSEVAFWPHADEHAKGVMQAVADLPGTEVILESTANGLGNYFHAQWQLAEAGQSEYIAIFVPWYWQDEYRKPLPEGFKRTDKEDQLVELYGLTDEQIMFRRMKIQELSASGIDGDKAFMQEYPCTAVEAFQTTGSDSFIAPDLVMKARKSAPQAIGPIVIGVDPARFGEDRTSIIFRCGRVAYNLMSFEKKDTMEVAGIVHKLIKDSRLPIARVFVDVGGLGAGVVDRLREMGYSKLICPVNGGESPLDAERYVNKRAEMWGEMKAWLMDAPCQIPDSNSLHADLCGPSYKFDSKTRLVLEKKEDMKKRGIRSPDEADALALTFAQPVRSENHVSGPRRAITEYSMIG